MQSVFISSVQEGFERVRQAARRAVENLGLRPVMAELAGAWPETPRSALLSLVREADAFLLILGPRYSRPTEDEFDEARRLGKPIFVLKQDVGFEPAQEEFLEHPCPAIPVTATDAYAGRFKSRFERGVDSVVAEVRLDDEVSVVDPTYARAWGEPDGLALARR